MTISNMNIKKAIKVRKDEKFTNRSLKSLAELKNKQMRDSYEIFNSFLPI